MHLINRGIRYRLLTVISVTVLLGACAVHPVRHVAASEPSALPANVFSNTIDLSTVTVRLPYDEAKMRIQYGLFCEFGNEVTLPNERLPITKRDIEETFRRALGPLNYKFPKPSESVFQSLTSDSPQLLLGATVIRREASLCFPFSGSPTLSYGNINSAKGSAYLQITWEVFSFSEKKVVLKRTTEGAFRADNTIVDGEKITTLNALKASLLSLAADPQFKELILQK